MNRPEVIIIHHSATKDGLAKDFNAIKNYHVNTLGWYDIGYNWIVERVNGVATVIKGRDEMISGAHTKQQGMNSKSISISFVGNYDIDELPSDMFRVGVELIKDIRKRYKKDFELEPHSKYANKTCPGKKFPLELMKKASVEKFDPIKILVDKKLINSPDYWLANAKMGEVCKGEYVLELISNIAKSL